MSVRQADTQLRLGVLGVSVLSLLAILLIRLWYLQVIAAPELRAQVSANAVRTVLDPAPRGRILDRTGRVVVDNRPLFVVTYDTTVTERRDATLTRLSTLLNVSKATLDTRVRAQRSGPFRPVELARDVPEATLVYIKEHPALFPGVEAEVAAERSYPLGTLAAHVLGHVGEITADQLKANKSKGYRPGDEFGQEGVEAAYEADLRGTAGRRVLEVDARGRVVRTVSVVPPVAGNDVQLTIDVDIQRLAEESLEQGIMAARATKDRAGRFFRAPGGAAVVIDPDDGSILAIASYPTFDPAVFAGGIREQAADRLYNDRSRPLFNRATYGAYPPGSTFKLITAIAAVADGAVRPKDRIADSTGCIKVAKQSFCNAQKAIFYDTDLTKALTVSSDVYFYRMGERFDSQSGLDAYGIQNMARTFGFGSSTGIETGDTPGVVPDGDYKAKLAKETPDFGDARWRTGDNVNFAVGQGYLLVSPLQLANAYASFANGGKVFENHLGAQVIRGATVKRRVEPELRAEVAIAPELRDPIVTGLSGVVGSRSGTAWDAFKTFPLRSVPIAAKTGTAEKAGQQDSAVFAAFVPAAAPEYAVTIFVEEGGWGGQTAAPIARRIIDGLVGRPVRDVVLARAGTTA